MILYFINLFVLLLTNESKCVIIFTVNFKHSILKVLYERKKTMTKFVFTAKYYFYFYFTLKNKSCFVAEKSL